MRSRGLAVLALACALVLLLPGLAHAAPGDPDPSFGGGDGEVTIDFDGNEDRLGMLALAPGGKIVAAGSSHDGVDADVAVTRLLTNGDPDPGFGTNGRATTKFAGRDQDMDNALAVLPDGRILVAGTSRGSTGDDKGFVVKYESDGDPDNTFSVDSKVLLNFGSVDVFIYDMAVQPDGKIVLSGEVDPTDDTSSFLIVRLNPNGALDSTFSGDGSVTTPFGEGFDGAWRVGLMADGRIVAGGWTELANAYGTALARYKPDGKLDRTFGGDGKVVTILDHEFDNYLSGMRVLPSGKVLVSLYYSPDSEAVVLMRYLADGRLDDTFSSDGVVSFTFPGGAETYDVALQANGKILIAARVGSGTESHMSVIRLLTGGRRDPSFGDGGLAQASFTQEAEVVEVQADGRILIGGSHVSESVNQDFAIARFLA